MWSGFCRSFLFNYFFMDRHVSYVRRMLSMCAMLYSMRQACAWRSVRVFQWSCKVSSPPPVNLDLFFGILILSHQWLQFSTFRLLPGVACRSGYLMSHLCMPHLAVHDSWDFCWNILGLIGAWLFLLWAKRLSFLTFQWPRHASLGMAQRYSNPDLLLLSFSLSLRKNTK